MLNLAVKVLINIIDDKPGRRRLLEGRVQFGKVPVYGIVSNIIALPN
jgi:hypothetical protein